VGPIIVEGEISGWKPHELGRFFALKDEKSLISAVIWNRSLSRLNFVPKDGMLVRARGRLSVYSKRGTYSLNVESMELAGTGEILALLERRKLKLQAEGLFDEERKKDIPRFPAVVGVVTSPTGAAIRDILNILLRRAAGVRVIVLPAPVQGEEAAPVLAARIRQANFWHLCDVLIVGRGGGPLEDLLPFSEEEVVRAIAESEIPVISAVGHEIDWALSDFAADLRAPTPSAAAELVSENHEETAESIAGFVEVLRRAIEARLERVRLLISPFAPAELEYRFRGILQPRLLRFKDARDGLLSALAERIKAARLRLNMARTALEAASPLAILERGYSVVTREGSGEAVRSAASLTSGERLRIRPKEGSFKATGTWK